MLEICDTILHSPILHGDVFSSTSLQTIFITLKISLLPFVAASERLLLSRRQIPLPDPIVVQYLLIPVEIL